MTPHRPPHVALAILRVLHADAALVGDLIEEFEIRRSRAWFWRQVLGAVPALALGRARDPQPHRWRAINLTAAPRGSAVGGLGLLALVALVSVVSPESWLIPAAGALGGVLLGVGLILTGRRRVHRPPENPRPLQLR